MIATAPGWIVDTGIIAGSTTAVIALLTAFVKSRIGQWVIRKISEDMREHRRQEMQELIAPVLAELRPNGGSSFRDEVNRFIAYQHDWNHTQKNDLAAVRGFVHLNTDRIDRIELDVKRVLVQTEGDTE